MKPTVPARMVTLLSGLLLMPCIAGSPVSVTISQSSIRINGVELRSGPPGASGKYITLAAAEKVLGKPQNTYVAGLGVRVYAWRDAGIHMQRGFRGSDEGKIFKVQVWFVDTYKQG
ncbi:MAG TPA: hypothetical protein VFA61_06550 [Candidatus Udaeobacter sp.]|nr:hypothetical protein [Candidatus Udaeobacter sp.]